LWLLLVQYQTNLKTIGEEQPIPLPQLLSIDIRPIGTKQTTSKNKQRKQTTKTENEITKTNKLTKQNN
jgi:hypothetical protein